MKRFLMALFAAVTLLAAVPSALAAGGEAPVHTIPEKVIIHEKFKPTGIGLYSLEDGEWEEDWTCYKDQLTGEARIIYEALEVIFANDGLLLTQGYWMADPLVSEEIPTATLDAWLDSYFEEIYRVCLAFTWDHPEYFWIRSYLSYWYSYYYTSDGICVSLGVGFVALPYTNTLEKRNSLQAQIDEVVDGLLEETKDMTTLGKLLYMDSWLAEQNHYNHPAAEDPNYFQSDETPWSIVGSLLDGFSPVCEGYAKAFQLFCHEIGVPCLQVIDYGHMWTYVQYENTWYLCDPTWDDPTYWDGEDRDWSTREYFMVGGPDMDHQPTMDEFGMLLPELSAEDLDYSCANGHNYAAVVTNPTCTEGGYTTHTCSVCGESYVDTYVDATGHSHDAVVTAPTCTEGGYTTHTCSVCGDSYVDGYVDATGHSHDSVVTDPTCTEPGYTTHTCVCGDSYVDTHVDALGHSFTHYEEEEGLRIAHCDRSCGATDETVGEASWRIVDGELVGAEYGIGSVMIVLYDGHDRLIGAAFCQTTFWRTVDGVDIFRFEAPELDSALLGRAAKILCFNWDGNYAPLRAVKSIE